MEKIFEIEDSESQENTEPENAELHAPANTEARASANTEARAPANAKSRQRNNETFTTTTQEIQGHESATPQNAPLENVSGAVARGNEKLLNNGSSENQPETATRHNDDDKKCSGNVNGDESQGRQQNVSTMSSSGSKRANSKQTTRESPASRDEHLREQKRLKEENDMLKQQSLCTKCHVNDVCIVFLPCGHLVSCETCAPTVRYCTVVTCGKYIKGTVRTYLA
ncbi:E3 ubiquitin-protein ligase cblA-like [Ruditapes philippinarum]|uniref:E3 ubiquitin-protein ligase cblA-like n=1 Tax=Ruditapes philippinarum TaxID=129788 RepID=UPI00295A85CF|nr:E3 ubiquitin-protein ligase cblA-like [Ruditapes philippinarum]